MANHTIFIGTYSSGAGKGLLSGKFNDETGVLTLDKSLDVMNSSYLAISEDKSILYGVSETSSFSGSNGGAVFSVRFNDDRKMDLETITGSHGASPCHLCVHGDFVFVANYTEGSLSVLELNEEGGLTPCYHCIHHFGSGPNAMRQEKSHIHFASMTPDEAFLAVCDLGLDKVFLYPFDPESGLSMKAKSICCPPGSGPRHLIFSNDGKYLYILTEMGSTVLVYEYNNGDTEFLQEVSTLPDEFEGNTTAAAIHISPDGHVLAASNRGHDSVALFRVQPGGLLSPPSFVKTGAEPRDFNFSPNGEWLLSADQNDNTITVYKAEDGGFKKNNVVEAPRPVCILFI